MGIQGLLPLLKECQKQTHVKEYKGQTLAIDAYVWLHRGAYGCAQEIATGVQTVKYVKYAMHRVRLLKHYGVTPYVVFDGGLLPSKLGTENDRESRRMDALTRANALAADGKHAQAREYYVKAVDVTPQMAYQLIKALIAENVSYVVAPYEADAQLAYLEKKGIVDGIITEDSDLLVFGCKKVLFKMDSEGACVEIKRDKFTMCREFSFSGWTDAEFRQMAILSGCDYLDNIQGLGIKTSHRLMRKYKTGEKVIRYLRLDGNYKIPRNYSEEYKRAEMTFVHQRVFCPEERKLVHLEPLPDHLASSVEMIEALRFVGPDMEAATALGIARGDLCPISKAKMIDIAPDSGVLAAAPGALRASSSTEKSIKDYFKPAPPAQKTKKRPALREVTSKNLFSATKKEQTIAEGPPVQSRFFAFTSQSKKGDRLEVLTVTDDDGEVGEASGSGDQSQETEEQTGQSSEEATLLLDEDEMEEDAEVYKLAEALTQAAEAQSDDLDVEADATAETSAGQMDVEMLDANIKESHLPHVSTPPRPATPRQPLSEAGFSHISSPTNTGRRSGSKRTRLDDSGFGEEEENGSDGAPILSSPGFMLLDANVNVKVKAERRSPRPSSSDNPIDLSDLSSPDSKPPKISGRLAVKAEPIRSPGRRMIKRKRSDTIEEDWTSDPIEPEGTAAAGPSQRPKRSSGMDEARFEARAQTQRAPTVARKGGSQLKRHNATLPKTSKKAGKAPAPRDDSVEPADEQPDGAITSVLASWREKFSSSTGSTRKSKKTGSSTSFVFPSQRRRPSPAPQKPERVRSSSPSEAAEMSEESSRQASRPKLHRQSTLVDEQAGPSVPASTLSATTYRALDAFRFKPSQSQISPSLSSSSLSS